MSGYRDRKMFDTCFLDSLDQENIKQSNYHFYPGYRKNDNSCINYPTGQTNLFGGNKDELGDRSEIESLLQLRNYVDNNTEKLNDKNSRCSNVPSNNMDKYKNTMLKNKMNTYYKNNILNICPRGQEILSTKLDVLDNRERNINRLDNLNNDLHIFYGINGTDQFHSNRFGVNTQLQAKDQIKQLKNKNNKKNNKINNNNNNNNINNRNNINLTHGLVK